MLLLSMPFLSASHENQTPLKEEKCEICPLNPSTDYCEGLSNFIESLKESRDLAHEENRMIVYTFLFMMVKWNTIKYVVICA